MPKLISPNFGPVEYGPGEPFVFPNALPGFPLETAFLPIEIPDQLPLLYLQSLHTPDLCFVTLPVRCIVGNYELSPGMEELAVIELGPDSQPGPGMLCLALICFAEDGSALANLRAPIIVNVRNRAGIQVIQSHDRYPFRYPIPPQKEAARCS